jgi:acyl carrier protein
MNTIETQIIELTKKHVRKTPDVSLQSHLKEDLGLDSLSLTELVVDCEEHFEIEIDLDIIDPKSIVNLFDLYLLVQDKVNAS